MKSTTLFVYGTEESVEEVLRAFLDTLLNFRYSDDLEVRAEQMRTIAGVLADIGKGIEG